MAIAGVQAPQPWQQPYLISDSEFSYSDSGHNQMYEFKQISVHMTRFKFKPATPTKLIAAGLCFGLINYIMLTFGFEQTHGTVTKSILVGALFSLGMWFISSLLAKQGALNKRLKRSDSKTDLK